ncbi:hypothetical protein C0991_003073 [Blastosporella zonata]|nr:hypothetical protein C0991_003073 [Blastosporella zonata]
MARLPVRPSLLPLFGHHCDKKSSELERDLELERRKIRELQDMSRDREKEYQKLKLQLEKFKRKALLAPQTHGHENLSGYGNHSNEEQSRQQQQRTFGMGLAMNNVNIGAVVGGMESNGRAPLVNRPTTFAPQAQGNATWAQQQPPQLGHSRNKSHRQPFAAPTDRSYRSTTDQSDGANEVENLLLSNQNGGRGHTNHGGWSSTPQQQHTLRPNHQNVQGMLPVNSERSMPLIY